MYEGPKYEEIRRRYSEKKYWAMKMYSDYGNNAYSDMEILKKMIDLGNDEECDIKKVNEKYNTLNKQHIDKFIQKHDLLEFNYTKKLEAEELQRKQGRQSKEIARDVWMFS